MKNLELTYKDCEARHEDGTCGHYPYFNLPLKCHQICKTNGLFWPKILTKLIFNMDDISFREHNETEPYKSIMARTLELRQKARERKYLYGKICMIIGCSKKKLTEWISPHGKKKYIIPAIELNQGQLFRSLKDLGEKMEIDIKILSGKYGLMDPDDFVKPYNQKIETKSDINSMRIKIKERISEIKRKYDKIIVFMGGNYRKVVEPYYNHKFRVIFDKRGIGGYLSLAKDFKEISKAQFLKEIEKFQVDNNAKQSENHKEFQESLTKYIKNI